MQGNACLPQHGDYRTHLEPGGPVSRSQFNQFLPVFPWATCLTLLTLCFQIWQDKSSHGLRLCRNEMRFCSDSKGCDHSAQGS